MRIVVINGTEVKGCTFHMKETFMSALKDKNEIIEFYLPRDMPYFCISDVCASNSWTGQGLT